MGQDLTKLGVILSRLFFGHFEKNSMPKKLKQIFKKLEQIIQKLNNHSVLLGDGQITEISYDF